MDTDFLHQTFAHEDLYSCISEEKTLLGLVEA